MAYGSIVEFLDRLSVRSVLRGSTASIWGVIGTLIVLVLCMSIYISPTLGFLDGDYYETEFYTTSDLQKTFYSNTDFKVAVVFRNRKTGKVANHTKILEFALGTFTQWLPDYSAYYQQPAVGCRPDYFSDVKDPIMLQDCYIFPENVSFNMLYKYGSFTQLFFRLIAKKSPNPFDSRRGIALTSLQAQLQKLLIDFYYEVLFTSKIINSAGKAQLQLHRFYSTENEPTSNVAASWNEIILTTRTTVIDDSVMPWRNNKTITNLVWLGRIFGYRQFIGNDAAIYGINAIFTLQKDFHLTAYRYYRKLDWLLGIIGGAMLLFYLILWLPCTYINRTLHRIRNTEALVLLSTAKQDENRLLKQNIVTPKIKKSYWLSNSILYFFFPSLKQDRDIVKAGQRELDIVRLFQKIKIIERTLSRKQLLTEFKPKILKVTQDLKQVEMKESNAENAEGEQSYNQMDREEDPPLRPIVEFQDEIVDPVFGLTQKQKEFLQSDQQAVNIYSNNQTALVIAQNQQALQKIRQIQCRDKWYSKYPKRKHMWVVRMFYRICGFIEKFDMFGARPTLEAQPHNTSFIGFLTTAAIVALSLLTVALTLSNAKQPQIKIHENFLPELGINYSLRTKDQLKLAVCFSSISAIKGNSKKANFRFFAQSKTKGRRYIPSTSLSSSDFTLFGFNSASESPISLSYCFAITDGYDISMSSTPEDSQHFGFIVEPYCVGTAAYCASISNTTTGNFQRFINSSYVYLFLPENKFDPVERRFINNLAYQPLNVNSRYLRNNTALQETVFVDEVRIQDDTTNFFMRKEAINTFKGIAKNAHTPYSLARNIENSSSYYEVHIRPSNNQVLYWIETPKADTLLGIIGGVFVFWYAVVHWLGKLYNNYELRAKLAEAVYEEDAAQDCFFNKVLGCCYVPQCLLPECCNIREDVMRARLVDRKIINDLDYLWLVKYVDSCYRLSSGLFSRLESKNLSMVYVKQKIDEAEPVRPPVEKIEEYNADDFLDLPDDDVNHQGNPDRTRGGNSVLNDSLNNLRGMSSQKIKNIESQYNYQMGPPEDLSENRHFGHRKPFVLSWMDSFEYPSSLTFKGRREVTSCCGGCCFLILLAFILIISYFEVGIYLTRSDMRIGMTTSVMKPVQAQSNETFNSRISLNTGKNFKLAVTLSSAYHDYPHDVNNITGLIGFTVFQTTFRKVNGTIVPEIQSYPLQPCRKDYLLQWASPLVDPAYYSRTQFGFCVPDGVNLIIEGLPQDSVSKNFKLSIYDKVKNATSKQVIKDFLQRYYPVYHFSVPHKDFNTRQITYDISSMVFDPYNITTSVQQNLTLSKMRIVYDDAIGWDKNPDAQQTYSFNAFRQEEADYYGTLTDQLSYNLTFANSYLLETYTLRGDKFYQTFGIIGGIIAFFLFGIAILPRAYNEYRLRYLIGRELYLFDILKKKQAKAAARHRKRKTKEELLSLSDLNDMNQARLIFSFVLGWAGGILSNYNFSKVLRRSTLMQQRVRKELSLYEFYTRLHRARDVLNQRYIHTGQSLADIYFKNIINPDPLDYDIAKIKNANPILMSYAKKHNWSGYERFAVTKALQARVNLREVFDSAFLDSTLHVPEGDQSVHLSDLGGTLGSIGTNSVAEASEILPEDRE